MIPLADAAHKPIEERQTVMDEDIPVPFDLPAVARKKVSAFDGGRITSDGGVMLLAQAERRLGVACPDATLIRNIAAALMPMGP
jgi:hypothetical protein